MKFNIKFEHYSLQIEVERTPQFTPPRLDQEIGPQDLSDIKNNSADFHKLTLSCTSLINESNTVHVIDGIILGLDEDEMAEELEYYLKDHHILDDLNKYHQLFDAEFGPSWAKVKSKKI